MEYDAEKREIYLNRELSNLDLLVLNFLRVLEKHADYVLISGYISILLGRSRSTEDIDLFLEEISFERFFSLYEDLKKAGFWCLNSGNVEELYSYLKDGLAIRFAIENTSIPNFEVKFPKREIDRGTFEDFIRVIMPGGKVKISSLERQIAFKRYYLKSQKDIEDAVHVEKIFGDKINREKINKFKIILEGL